MQMIYVVTMKRWGDDDSHNYVIGVFTTEDDAIKAGCSEKEYRGGKYESVISICKLDERSK